MNGPFLQAAPLLVEIEKAGFEAFFVGGSVRDFLAGREINDVDIASSATPQEIKGIFPKTVDVGIEHGTVLVLFGGDSYEITTFRTEAGYSDYRRPDQVQFIRSLEDDLKRRDFTMNAMAMDKDGTVYDPFNGRTSIQNRVITAVGNPDERFGEDALRMIRAIRFVSQLGYRLEESVIASIKNNASLLKNVSVERLLVEFEKILNGPKQKDAIHLLIETGLYQSLPGLQDEEEALKVFNSLDMELNLYERWTVLVLTIQPPNVEAFCRSWKMPVLLMKDIKRTGDLIRNHSGFWDDEFVLFSAGRAGAQSAARVQAVLEARDPAAAAKRAEMNYDKLVIKTMNELDVNGKDLLAWSSQKQGAWIKQALESALKAVLSGEIDNNKAAIKEWLEQCNRI